ncbi:MAG: hypothetical protein HOW73_10260 [Polyangiaceae bacterium]|nr:hypothetical protein [Polyangiaceae bacterium]
MRAARSILVSGSVLALCCLSSVSLLAAPLSEGLSKPSEIAQAPDASSVKAEIIVLHATNDGKGIDPSIGKMPELGEPPFSAYNSYKQLDKFELELAKGKAKDHKLPDGGKLAVTFKEATKGKKKDDPMRYVLATSIDKPDGKAFLPSLDVNALQGKYFFIAGQKYEKGILVIGIKVK